MPLTLVLDGDEVVADYLPSVDDVRAVISTSLTDSQITQMILEADAITSQCSGIASSGEILRAAINKYFVAHMIALLSGNGSGVVQSESLGDASVSYVQALVPNLGTLSSTRYGQQAITLDTSGCLANLGKMRVSFKVL